MLSFSANRPDIVIAPECGNPIAPGCRGSLADGSCTLDEFAEYTRQPKPGRKPFPAGLIGSSLTPDPLAVVTAIDGSGYDTSQWMDTYKLLPEMYPAEEKKSGFLPNFADQVEAINYYVYKALFYMAKTLRFSLAIVDSWPNYVNLRIGIRGIADMRRADFSSLTLSALMSEIEEAGITPVLRTVVAVDLTTYKELDTGLTLSGGSTNPSIDTMTAVDDAVAAIGEKSSKGANRRHWAVISSLDKWTSDLDSGFQC
ncbi:hypothetical protein SBOR_4863 [Sclerotinia borealis F-4128]|uniref:Uncharacterized protein n=1 Tax=Sclerotinia borealis (strain F-4128) TaxID=1432307 RepID=W9CFV8_SCLBF|nr:hypothetical protein SBOR_4863 [Sclerotinia borealis F-4128]